jgi:hypothetical protein
MSSPPIVLVRLRIAEIAERAVRAGLGAIEALSRLDTKSVNLRTRVGIATELVGCRRLIGLGRPRNNRS